MKFEFYTVLKEISSSVEPSVLYFFIKKISKVSINLLKAVELELMSQIIDKMQKGKAEAKVNLACGLEFLWDYLHG